jgi:hypothetical protein
MADQKSTKDQNDNGPDLDLSEDEAEKLLDDAPEDVDSDGAEDESERDSELRGEIDKWKSLSRKNEKAFKDAAAKLKKYEDQGKSETQRLQETAAEHQSRAEKAESQARAMQIAMDRAPEHASLAQVRAVAKRVRGDDEDALERDADELFELLAPEPKAAPKTPGRPQPRLKGGTAEPDEDPEETDPRKLAAQLPRRR